MLSDVDRAAAVVCLMKRGHEDPRHLEELPPGLDKQLASFLPSASLAALACAHRCLGRYIGFVRRVTGLDTRRLECLLRLWERKPRCTPFLRCLSFDRSVDWECDDASLAGRLARAIADEACPLLEELDLSDNDMHRYDLVELLSSVRSSTRLRTLHLPDLSCQSVDGVASEVAALPYLEEIIERSGGRSVTHLATRSGGALARRLKALSQKWIFHGRRFVGEAELQGVSCLTCCPGLRSIKIEISSEHLMDLVVAGMSMRQAWASGCLKDAEEVTIFTTVAKPVDVVLSRDFCAWRPDLTRHLRVLRLRGLFFGFEGGCTLGQALQTGSFPSLQVLDLSSNVLTDIGLTRLAASLSAGFAPCLASLDLSLSNPHLRTMQSSITTDSLYDLSEALVRRAVQGCAVPLRVLRLSGQGVGDDGMAEIAKAMAAGGLDLLEELEVRENGVTDEGVEALLRGVASGRARGAVGLKRLDVQRNRVRAMALEVDVGLQGVDLGRNNVSVDGLCRMLRGSGAGLRELVVGGGEVEDEAVMASMVSLGFECLPRLTALDLRRVEAGPEAVRALVDGLREGHWPRLDRLVLCVSRAVQAHAVVEEVRQCRPGMQAVEVLVAPKPR